VMTAAPLVFANCARQAAGSILMDAAAATSITGETACWGEGLRRQQQLRVMLLLLLLQGSGTHLAGRRWWR
jgi:hypothetical protein